MPPLDWKKIMSVDVDDFDEDAFFNPLSEFDVEEEDNVEHLRKLFQVTQAVMLVKGTQADVAMEEVEKLQAAEAKSGVAKEIQLEDKIRELELQVKDYEKYGADSGGAGRDTKFLRDEITDLERRNQMLQDDAAQTERELAEEKKTVERYTSRVSELEKELNNVKADNDRLQDDLQDCQRKLSQQNERMTLRPAEAEEYADKINRKNRELIIASEEIENLSKANDELDTKLTQMKKDYDAAREEMDKLTTNYIEVKTKLDNYDEEMEKVKKEGELHKAQVLDLNEQVQSKKEVDDEIMIAVNNKVEEWKNRLAEKDQEVLEYHQQNQKLKEQLRAANMDSERASVAVLSQAVQDRDKEINQLKEHVEIYTSELESNAALIEDLQDELSKAGRGAEDKNIMKIRELQMKLRKADTEVKDADERVKQTEEEARKRDQELADMMDKMTKYESGVYGLPEAIAEIKSYKDQVHIRDRQIEDLTKEQNKTLEQVNDLEDENEELREKCGLEPKVPLDMEAVKNSKKSQYQKDRALNRILTKEVERLEEERVDLKKQIRRMAQQGGTRAAALGLDAEDIIKIEKFTDDLKEKRKKMN